MTFDGPGGKPVDDDAREANGLAAEPEPYKVGKGKPPREHQFKKGNKRGKGRPKGAKNIKTIVQEARSARVRVKVDGEIRSIPKGELVIHQVYNQASAGNPRAIDKAIMLEERYGPQEDPAGPAPEQIKMDLDALRDFLKYRDMIDLPEEEGDDA